MSRSGSPQPRVITEALTFDDVLLVPRHSTVHPRETRIDSLLTRSISLPVPLLSAAMDTVTESGMAIAMAREGGLGIIHKNMRAERQAEEVDRVKRSESGIVVTPVTVGPRITVREAVRLMDRFGISGMPVVDEETALLVGILTSRDLRFVSDLDQRVEAVMTREGLITAPEGTSLADAEAILHRNRIEKLPVVDAEGRLRGLITFKDINKRRQFPNACKDELGRLRVGAAIGAGPTDMERARRLVDAGADVLVVDTAHGHAEAVLAAVGRAREAFPDTQIIAGNVATREGAAALVERGVDAVKVGVGPGSICTTRVVTGVGVPQLTAVLEAVAGVEGRVPIIADGGVKYSGDLVKALAAGAHSVMMGSMFAGTEEAPGEAFLLEGRRFKIVRGMGSLGAMQEGSADRYFQDESDGRKFVPEGIEGRVAYKGPVADTIYQLVGGLRSGMGYLGCATVEELRTEPEFVRITSGGLRESHPHDVTVTREAPNYHG